MKDLPKISVELGLTPHDLVLVAAALEWAMEENRRRGQEGEALLMHGLRERWMRAFGLEKRIGRIVLPTSTAGEH